MIVMVDIVVQIWAGSIPGFGKRVFNLNTGFFFQWNFANSIIEGTSSLGGVKNF